MIEQSTSPVIIAEACQNHNGDLSILKEMIYAAKDAGADYIKIQSIFADDLTKRDRFENGIIEDGVIKAIKRPYKEEYDRLKPMDLGDDGHAIFINECKKAGIKPLTTIFSYSKIEFLAALGWENVKVASYDCASFPFLKEIKNHFQHLFISTGATTDQEIQEASSILKDHSYSFLHCVTIYPTPLNEMHLNRMNWLRKYSKTVGFSDHSLVKRDGLKASKVALYLGADIIERHFTILDSEKTKDGPVSINPSQLKDLVEFSRLDKEKQKIYLDENIPQFDLMLGSSKRSLSDVELINRDYYRGRFAFYNRNKYVYNWEELDR